MDLYDRILDALTKGITAVRIKSPHPVNVTLTMLDLEWTIASFDLPPEGSA